MYVFFEDSEVIGLAWVLEYVAESDEPDEPGDNVVSVARKFIDLVKDQMTPEEIAEIEIHLKARPIRCGKSLWISNDSVPV